MRTSNTKEIKIFCDKETGVALVRIFKYRNYLWAGGDTIEMKKGSPALDVLAEIICKFSVEKVEKEKVLWNEDSDVAITYILDMEKAEVQTAE